MGSVLRLSSVVLLVLPLIAGCLSGPGTPTTAPSADILPPASSVDLHKSLLNISMPAGASSVGVRLQVPADLWVHDYVPVYNPLFPPENPNRWRVCVLLQTHGLTGELHALTFLIDGSTLLPASTEWPLPDIWNSGDGAEPLCLDSAAGQGLVADQPRDVELLVLLAIVVPQNATREGQQTEPFRLTLGIGNAPCPYFRDAVPAVPFGWTYCGPDEQRSVEPTFRGPEAPQYSIYVTDFDCRYCQGFEVDDRRQTTDTPQGVFSTGPVAASRVLATGPAIVALRGFSGGGQGAAQIDLTATLDGASQRLECTKATAGVEAGVIGWMGQGGNVSFASDSAGTHRMAVRALEIPLDLQSLGWTYATQTFERTGDDIADFATPRGLVPCTPHP